MQIDGTQWAGSFAFNAFFSLFPLFILFVIFASFFVDRDSAVRAIMALLLWIYLSGCGFIFGACLCATQAEERSE